MNSVCLDMEGVLVPEIWIAFAEASGIPELRRTTRDEPDYDKLMRWRLSVLKEHGLGLKEIQDVIAKINPMQLQRSGDDPGQQGRFPVPQHRPDQGGLSPDSRL